MSGERFDPRALAEAVRAEMIETDRVTQSLGLRIEAVAPGYARAAMTVRRDMLNSLGLCHGGMVTTLADTAFAYACNSHGELTVAAGITIDILCPSREGDCLTAVAREAARHGRNGIYDIAVTNQHGATVAMMRGRSHTTKDRHLAACPHCPQSRSSQPREEKK